MHPADATVPIDTLLAHREWVRTLARSLVHDEASADDLEQRTWMAALRRPPPRMRSVRGWLACVVRSQAIDMFRARGRRAAHERRGARRGEGRSALEVVEEAEVHRRLVNAVLELSEPYRSTVLLRFFERMPPRRIAKLTGVPVETVRTRVRRALLLLRDRLGGDEGRAAWVAALAPLTGSRAEVTAPASGSVGVAMAGGASMIAKSTTLAVALALVAGFAGGRFHGADAGASTRVSALDSSATHAAVAVDGAGRRGRSSPGRLVGADAAPSVHSRVAAAVDGPRPASELTDAELLARVEDLTERAQDRRTIAACDDALAACEVLGKRALAPDQRVRGLLFEGRVLHVLGKRAERDARFLAATVVEGAAPHLVRDAAVEHAHGPRFDGDEREAAQRFLSVAQRARLSPAEQSYCRYQAAASFGAAGDADRAADEYRAVVNEFGASDEAGARKWAAAAQAELDRGGGAASRSRGRTQREMRKR